MRAVAIQNPGVPRRGALSFAADGANLLTLCGLLCGLLGIYFAIRGTFSAAMIAMLWAAFFDWFDGPLARRVAGRTDDDRAFGAQLDSLVDVVSSAVCPAIVLLSVGAFSPWFLPGAFALVAAGVMRLSYFNVFGLEDASAYRGLPVDHNILVFALVFILHGWSSDEAFAIILYGVTVGLACLNVAPFRMPKADGVWYVGFVAFVVGLTVLYGARLLAI